MTVSLDREMEEFLTTTVTVQAHASVNVMGAQTFSTASRTVLARIEHDTRLVRDQTGREIVSVATVFLKPVAEDGTTYTLSVRDLITLPSGYTPQTPPIITIARNLGPTALGIDHWEVAL